MNSGGVGWRARLRCVRENAVNGQEREVVVELDGAR